MPATGNTVVIEGLAEFRAAVRRAQGAAPKLLTAGLKRAGEPIIQRASVAMPRRTGRLASSLTTSVRGARADIVSRVPYAGGAEWGRFGKWSGFERYGSPPRFVWPAVESQADVVVERVAQELKDVIAIYGWAR